jgi:hypothetical protein
MVKRGVLSVAGAIVAVLAVRWVAMAFVDVPPEFLPLAGPSAAGFFTTALGIAAVVVWAVVRRFAKHPERTFRWLAVVALLASFLPDLWLLSEAGAEQFEGSTRGGVMILMVLHVVAAGVIVPGLTLGTDRKAQT